MENHLDIIDKRALAIRIAHLRTEKCLQRENLHQQFAELESSFHPINLLKSSMGKLAEDHELRFDITKLGINLGANFAFQLLLGKHVALRTILGMLMAGKTSGGLVRGLLNSAALGITNIWGRDKPRPVYVHPDIPITVNENLAMDNIPTSVSKPSDTENSRYIDMGMIVFIAILSINGLNF